MKRFRKIYIEITNVCNMHCSFCPETKRKKEFIKVCNFNKILDEIKKYTDYVYLHVKGEPLIHPKLDEIINMCNEYKMKVNISTNGVLIKDKVDILKKVRQVNISLHSFEKDEGLEKYIKDVIDATDVLKDFGVIIRYKLWNDDVKDNSKLIKLLEKRYNLEIKEELNKDIKLEDNVYLSIKKPFKWPDENEVLESNSGTCYGLIKQIAILVDGTVVPCCVDNDGVISLGNILNEDLESILNSKKAQDIINGFKNNKCVESLCRKCTYKNNVI